MRSEILRLLQKQLTLLPSLHLLSLHLLPLLRVLLLAQPSPPPPPQPTKLEKVQEAAPVTPIHTLLAGSSTQVVPTGMTIIDLVVPPLVVPMKTRKS